MPKPVVKLKQTHGDTIIFIDKEEQPNAHTHSADVVISSCDNLLLTVTTADCVPILYYDQTSRLIAASHQGWQGHLKKLPQKTVKALCKAGAEICTLKAAIGPCIGGCCYKLYGARLKFFKETFFRFADQIFVKHQNDSTLCLTALSYLLLRESGILPENIEYSLLCTSCNSAVFNSYNKSRTTKTMVNFIEKNRGTHI